ncbi:TPA: glycosyltransferase family 4 protein [Escherichia coli]|uniref:glycosyltransferase n=1 Tax=Escherichia coli TaxID=562 RepID=UPI0036FF1B7F|nr:glycosyltransferase family 4 protein [Escherichia coli]HBZ8252837.1 glycosyltransferase family 4 protein [Escherichia coli]
MLYIDFSAIKSGGGAQLAINFLIKAAPKIDCRIIISDKFPQLDLVPDSLDVIVLRSSWTGRISDEYVKIKKLLCSGDVVYTFFGPGLPKLKGVTQITGVAYPIVCNYDSRYWYRHRKSVTLPKRILNKAREFRLKKADFLIFETEIMRSRFCATHRFDYAKTAVVPPTPTGFLKANERSIASKNINFLLLTGLDYHKNIDLLLNALEKYDFNTCVSKPRFIISTTQEEFIRRFGDYSNKVLDYFDFTGKVASTEIQRIYDKTDVVLNLADLESFSNNYMEAWLAKKNILSHDTDFARYILGDSAWYVDAYDPLALQNIIVSICNSNLPDKPMITAGELNLNKLPSIDERVRKILSIIERFS